jgi:hypothetical protein
VEVFLYKDKKFSSMLCGNKDNSWKRGKQTEKKGREEEKERKRVEERRKQEKTEYSFAHSI